MCARAIERRAQEVRDHRVEGRALAKQYSQTSVEILFYKRFIDRLEGCDVKELYLAGVVHDPHHPVVRARIAEAQRPSIEAVAIFEAMKVSRCI